MRLKMLILDAISRGMTARMEALSRLITRPVSLEEQPDYYAQVIQWGQAIEKARDEEIVREWSIHSPVSALCARWHVNHQTVTGILRRYKLYQDEPISAAELKTEEQRDTVNEYQAEVKASMNRPVDTLRHESATEAIEKKQEESHATT